MSMQRQIPFEFVYQLSALIISVIIVHLVYVTMIRPNADAILQESAERAASGEAYVQPPSLYVVLRDYEQESCFILMFWAIAIMGFKARQTLQERNLLGQDVLQVTEGTSILPEDARQYIRPLQALPPDTQQLLVPRVRLR